MKKEIEAQPTETLPEGQAVDTTVQKDTHMTNLAVIFTAIVFGAIAAVNLFVPDIELKPVYLSYVVGAVIIIIGIVQIVRYFVTDAYRNINAYGFSIGTLLVILGVCALLRADVLGGVIDLILGIAVLLMGIIMLQHSLDLKSMKDVIWAFVIILSAIVIVCGVFLILKPAPEKLPYDAYTWWIVLVASGLGLLVNIYTIIRVAIFKHQEKKRAANELKEREQAIAAAAAARAEAEAITAPAQPEVSSYTQTGDDSYSSPDTVYGYNPAPEDTPMSENVADLTGEMPAEQDISSDPDSAANGENPAE
ncbi:MAG: DUF308 domain-containing protein [Lachnospiraceae bacterium]|nr:DUF308 domain-containing protein [Lachnospiraceae bacterium]